MGDVKAEDQVWFHSNSYYEDRVYYGSITTKLTLKSNGEVELVVDDRGNDDRSDACFFGSLVVFKGTWTAGGSDDDKKYSLHLTSKTETPNNSGMPRTEKVVDEQVSVQVLEPGKVKLNQTIIAKTRLAYVLLDNQQTRVDPDKDPNNVQNHPK
eukprot:TRINITY_DN51_c0_g1_i1.p1 TRINITY_DN51_c0_g1~~TRINITY_DN51_c0_g1_i1.p1  ORF type:complete len:154 (-),score=39.80 TRINITY_DN51_c0_g1_i1:171-632(-)